MNTASTKPFEWNAADYAKSSSMQQQWARELIQKLNLSGNEHVLDVGSGDGKVTAEIASAVSRGSVLGIDNSQSMVALSQSVFPTDAYSNLRFQLCDAKEISFNEEFDIVFSNATLHWIVDHRPVLKGIYTSLKHGGRILLQMGGRGNTQDVKNVFAKILIENEWKSYFNNFHFSYGFYGTEEYHEWLHETGFSSIRTALIPKDGMHKNREAFEGWFRTTWIPWTNRVPEQLRTKFITQMADAYLKQFPADVDGAVHVQMMRLEVEARKE